MIFLYCFEITPTTNEQREIVDIFLSKIYLFCYTHNNFLIKKNKSTQL